MSVDPTHLCQLEIPVSNMPRALSFYERAFGWRAAPAELHEYVVIDVPESCPYGIALVPRRGEPGRAGLTAYIRVEDPVAVCQAVVDAGGTKRFGPMQLPGYGTIFQVEDPDGNRWGLFAAKPGSL